MHDQPSQPETAPVLPSAQPARAERLYLLVMTEGSSETHGLPEAGEVTIGRGEAVDIHIDEPWISRRHALLELGPRLCVRDLGSANGTIVRGRRLPAGERSDLALGEPMDLGRSLLLVQKLALPAASLLWPPGGPSRNEIADGPESAPLPEGIVVQDAAMRDLYRLLERVATGTINVLFLGETGVGKEVVAERLHLLSSRRDKPFLRLHCAALSETLLESELFGHERGAFTGAVAAKPGLLETAHEGTVFLDEIGELPASIQVKLLRVLEERQVWRVGSLKPRAIDVRLVSATNRNLEAEVAAGRFRRDLYFRLNGIPILVPPLRARISEIAPLARAFVLEVSSKLRRTTAPRITEDALAELCRSEWPGNVRELRNVIERAVLLCSGPELTPAHLSLGAMPQLALQGESRPADQPGDEQARLRLALAESERRRIVQALEESAGNQTRAARLLGISRGTLLVWLDRHGLPRPRKRSDSTP